MERKVRVDNCIYQEEKLNNYSIEEYFNQLEGNSLLNDEERKIFNEILQKLTQTCKICSVSKVLTPTDFRVGNGELVLGEEKIHANLFEQYSFHDIKSILAFIVTVIEDDNRDIGAVTSNKQRLDLLDQYYETAWKYAALQGFRDHIIEEYKRKEIQSGKRVFTPILGPGYFGIDLLDSDKLYKLLNGRKLGVTLNDTMQFIPENTICGFMIGMQSISEDCKKIFDNPCQYCLSVKKACGYCSLINNK